MQQTDHAERPGEQRDPQGDGRNTLRPVSAPARWPAMASLPASSPDPISGWNGPDIQVNLFEWSMQERSRDAVRPHPFPGFTLTPVHLRSDGRVTVRLGSPDPFAWPAVLFDYLNIRSTKERLNPGILESVRVTAGYHALARQVVRVVRRKRHRGEAYVVVEVQDGSRQLVAVRNTELADGRSSSPDLHFTPGSLRALVEVTRDHRKRAQQDGADAVASPEQPSGLGVTSAGDVPAGLGTLDGTAAAPAASGRCDESRGTNWS